MLESTLGLFRKLKEAKALIKLLFKDMGAGESLAPPLNWWRLVALELKSTSQVHVAMDGLHPSVIACAETQDAFAGCDPSLTEMILDHYNKEWDLPTVSLGARASKVGEGKKAITQYVMDPNFSGCRRKTSPRVFWWIVLITPSAYFQRAKL